MAIFALVGPLIGFVLYSFLMPGAGYLSVFLIPVLTVLLRGLPLVFAYVLGLPPALFTAAVALSTLQFRRPYVYILTATLCGALASAVWPALMTIGATASSSSHRLPSLHELASAFPYVRLAATGAGAGAFCGWLTLPLGGFDPTAVLARLGSHPLLSRFRAGDVLLEMIVLLCVWLTATILIPALSHR